MPTALVTNACRYAGPHATTVLSEMGFRVFCHDASFAEADAREQFVQTHPDCVVLSQTQPAEAVAEALNNTDTPDTQDTIDVLFNNHLQIPEVKPITETTSTEFEDLLARLLVEPYEFVLAAVPGMKEHSRGKIIFMTSAAALKPMPNVSLYSAARAGANSLVKTLSVELGEFGISVFAICPNFYASEDTYSQHEFETNEKYRAAIERQVPLKRLSKEGEMAALIQYLANPDSDFITGQIISFSGGWA